MPRTNFATRADVMAVPQPAFTSTWHPFAHGDVIRGIREATQLNNLDVTDEEYCLTSNGANLFATWTVRHPSLDYDPGVEQFQLGFRNSLNKLMAIGVTIGTTVMVCSNMMFSGDFITFRKHTGGLDLNELNFFMARAVWDATERMRQLYDWHQMLKNVALSDNQAKILTYNAMAQGALAPSKFNYFRESFREELKLNGPTLYSWHGAGTRSCRENSLNQIARKTAILNSVTDDYLLLEAA